VVVSSKVYTKVGADECLISELQVDRPRDEGMGRAQYRSSNARKTHRHNAGTFFKGTLYMVGPHIVSVHTGLNHREPSASPQVSPQGHGSPHGKADLGSWPLQQKCFFFFSTTDPRPVKSALISTRHHRRHRGKETRERPAPPCTPFNAERL